MKTLIALLILVTIACSHTPPEEDRDKKKNQILIDMSEIEIELIEP